MGLRVRLLLLVLLPTLPALILAVNTSLQERQFGRAKAEKDAIRVVQLAAVKQLALVDAGRQHLVALSSFKEARTTNIPGFTAFFARFRQLYPDFTDFGLIETNGDLVACSYPQPGPVNLANRSFFQHVLRSGDLGSGTFQPLGTESKLTLFFGYPVRDEAGRLVRVVYASLDPAALNRAVAKTSLPTGWMISVLDGEGKILARQPAPDQWLGKPFADQSVISVINTQKEGTIEMHPRGDVARLCAFTPIGTSAEPNLYVSAGIPLSMAYSETRRILMMNLALLAVVAALAILAASIYADRYILRPLKALWDGTRQVTAGDLTARTGITEAPGEVNQLARAFDQMAESLQSQRLQNERLHAELEDRVKERTAQLEQTNHELEAFSYSVSHDLRAPLRHIHGYVGRLQDEAGAAWNENERRLLKLISDSAKRMGTLIDDLLAFSRMGRVELNRSWVVMDELLAEVVQEVKRDTEGRTIQWQIEQLPRVFADRALLKQVWANLLSNAVKYTRQREVTVVKIGASLQQGEFEFKVQDNGAGFDARYADKLFRVFERLHRPEEFEGTGIGLANVRRIIHRHGGRTWAEGQVNVGATFYFTLPVRKSPLSPNGTNLNGRRTETVA